MKHKNQGVQANITGFNIAKLFLSIFIIITITSCKKYVEVPPPINQVVSSEVFSNDQTATSAVLGLYSQIMASNLYFLNGTMSVYCGLSSDEINNVTTSTVYNPFFSNTIPSNNTTIQTQFWRYAYNYIYQANACIEGITASTGVDAATKQQLIGEMEFTRALCYFYLTNLFGDVPLETTTNYLVNEAMPRTPSSQVYQQIVTDLQNAQNSLPVAYPSAGTVRPNKYAATALLARVYLYENDWKDAVSSASSVISSGNYTLVSNLANVFLAGSTETIYQLLPVNTYNTAEGATFVPSSATVKPTFTLDSFLLSSFQTGDNRKLSWVGTNTISGTVYYYPFKYKVRSGTVKTEDNIVLRLAEQYLIRAEANAQLGDVTDAIKDINVIRNRAGLPSLSSSLSQQACLSAVSQENRIEFFAEWGHRWLDLKRTGQATNILGSEKSGWQTNAALYPIPYNDIYLNPNLVQNLGY